MLSGETAAGKYPVAALKAMAAIAETAENESDFYRRVHHVRTDNSRLSVSAATAHAAATTAAHIRAAAIITVSKSGETARLVSSCRPETPIIACVLDEKIQRRASLYWGVTPLIMPYAHSTDELINEAIGTAKEAGLIQDGDMVVVTAGVPVGVSGTTNMIKVHLVGNCLLSGVGIGDQTVTGKLCICRTIDEAKTKFKPGDILCAPFTNNDFLPYMREAAGIIVEEGGTNNHAAIVGLALEKAVIVGAFNAVRVLEDGTRISLDCERGLIQALAN
jgi:pyruvate kinase